MDELLQDEALSEDKLPAGPDDDPDDVAAPEDPLADNIEAQQALLKLYIQCKAEDRYARLVEVKDVKQAEFYWGGRQYIWWSSQDQRWNLPTQPVAGYGDVEIEDMPRFEFVTNIYQARGLMMIANVAGAPPRIRFFPDDADDQDDLETAEGRTKLAKLIQRWNPIQKLLQEESYHAWTGGFIALWARYVKNGEKYGLDSMPQYKESSESPDKSIICPECGWSSPADLAQPPVPCPKCGTLLTEENITEEEGIPSIEEGNPLEVEKGRESITCWGALNCCRPQHTNSQSQWHYFGIENEVHYAILRAEFKDVGDKIKPGLSLGADDTFERNARLSVSENTKLLTQTGANEANLCTFVNAWFRPTAFYILKDKEIRDELLELFPRGCRVEFTGEVYLRSEAQSMDDAVATTHVMPGRGQHRPAVGTSLLSVQDRVNTFSNIEAETYEYGIPVTYRASDTWDSQADSDQRAAPGLEVEVALRAGENINQRIMQLRADSVSPDMYEHSKELMGPQSDMLTGTYPALTGAGADQGAPDTLGQQTMQRDQAMGRMGIFYVNLKQLHADILTVACKEFEAYADGTVRIPTLGPSGDFESESVDITALTGSADAYPEGDESFPDLWNQQRATMMQVADSPYGAQLIQEAENAELFGKLTGIPDLKIPGIASRRKQLREINELTKIPQGMAMLQPLAPMVEVDPVTDDHDVEAKTCKSWLNSEPGQRIKRENPMGWEAVKKHMMQHLANIPKPEPAVKPLTPSISTAYKDMPPEAQASWLEKEFGIKVDPQAFLQQIAFERAKKSAGKPASGNGHQAVPPMGEPANGATGGL